MFKNTLQNLRKSKEETKRVTEEAHRQQRLLEAIELKKARRLMEMDTKMVDFPHADSFPEKKEQNEQMHQHTKLVGVTVKTIPVQKIVPNPYQPRKQFDDEMLLDLSESIQQHGLMQPITVRKMPQDTYQLIAGERRMRASKLANIEYISAIVIDADDEKVAILALLENLQRADLNYLEEAEGYDNLIKKYGFTQEELAFKMGKSQSTIANKIRLLKLSSEVKELLATYDLTERHARALLKLPDERMKLRVLNIVIEKGYNVRKTEELVAATMDKLAEKEREGAVPESVPRVTRVIKDMRIFVNTIKQSVEVMRNSGINAQATQVDKGEYMEFIIRVPKKTNVNLIS